MRNRTRSGLVPVLLASALLAMVVVTAQPANAQNRGGNGKVDFWLTVLHNNDGESQVINAGSGLEDFGGAARFLTVVDALREEATEANTISRGTDAGVVMVSSGDNFLAGPEFNASLVDDVFYDAVAMELIGYDAVNLGNHDFDFGPDILAEFLASYDDPPPYVSANLDFSGEDALQSFVDSGVIVPSTTVETGGQTVGIIGLETPNLPFISSPRNVEVSDELAAVVQSQVDALTADGVDIIVLSSHLQNISNEIDLVGMVDGLDVVVAGGGDELLADPSDRLIPGDEDAVFGSYPQIATDPDGDEVPVVTTSGEYRYVGKLVVGFDDEGNVIRINQGESGPVRVATGDCSGSRPCNDTVTPDPTMQAAVVDPVEEAVAALAEEVIADSEVDLDGLRGSVRSMETNEGNLIADSFLWQATELAPDFDVPAPDVALANGGGIRNNTVIPAGDITVLDTFDMLPFLNFLTLVPDVSRAQFKEIVENAVACTQEADFGTNPNCGSGRFAQIGGFSYTWSAAGTAQIVDADGNVTVEGSRVQSIVLDDGTSIVSDGSVDAGPAVDVAIVDFLARGGDQYPFRGVPFTNLGATYQQALANFIEAPVGDGGLGGVISATDYPEGGEGRIVSTP